MVYVTRHGQPDFRPPGAEPSPDYSPVDPGLSTLGRTQAALLGRRLKKMRFLGDIYSSPFRRTIETADLIAAEIPGVTFRPEPAIREIVVVPERLRAFTGMTLEQIKSLYPTLAPGATLPHPWWTCEAETGEAVLARVSPFLQKLTETTKRDVLLVGHGASAGAAMRYFCSLMPDVPTAFGPNWNCGLSAVSIGPPLESVLIQDVSHLSPEQITSNRKTKAERDRESGSTALGPIPDH